MRGVEAKARFSEETRVRSWDHPFEGWAQRKGDLRVKLLEQDDVLTFTLPFNQGRTQPWQSNRLRQKLQRVSYQSGMSEMAYG